VGSVPSDVRSPNRRLRMTNRFRLRRMSAERRWFPILTVVPALVLLLATSIAPLLYTVRDSFENYNMLSIVPQRFVGLSNYGQALHDNLFWQSLQTTVIFVLLVVTVQFAVGLGLALLLNRLPRFQQLCMTLLLIPTIISPAVASFQWIQLFNYQYGPLNFILSTLHLPVQAWTASPSTALASLLIVDFWQWTPFMTLLLFAGLKSLPPHVYEASRVDGGTAWHTFRYIVLPLLRPVIIIAIVLRVIATFKLFDIVYILTNGGPGISTENLPFYIYIQGFRYFNIGFASTMAIIQLIIVTLLTRFILHYMQRPVQEPHRGKGSAAATVAPEVM